MPIEPLTLTPIGVVRTPYIDRYQAPHQPGAAAVPAEGTIILEPGRNFEQALEDLAGFELIWVLYWFHRNSTWKPKVLPPRGGRRKRGLFATRSPHRPNPIGLSLLRLLEIDRRTLRVADIDLLDGTPVLDIKPYLPYAEAFPNARAGWVDEVTEAGADAGGDSFTLQWSPVAEEQIRWLLERHGIDLRSLAELRLGRDPAPHPYRRISRRDTGAFQLAVKSWRLIFQVVDGHVLIERIASGYPPERLLAAAAGSLHDHAAHEQFHLRWPGEM